MTNQSDATATITIRRAGPEDAHDVRTLLLELATHENSADAVHASLEDWRRMLADPSVVVLLAVAAEQPDSTSKSANLPSQNHQLEK